MSFVTIDKNTYWNFTLNSNPIKSLEKLIINGDFPSVCVNKIFEKINSSKLKTITINGKIIGEQLSFKKFVNLEYLELGEKFETSYPIDFSSNPNLSFLKILSWNFNHVLDLSFNTQLKALEFGDFGIFNHPLDLSHNTNLESLKLPSCYNHDLNLINCPIKKFIIDKNYKSLVHLEYKNLNEFIIIGLEWISPTKNNSNKITLNENNSDKLDDQQFKKRKLNPEKPNIKLYHEGEYIETNKKKFPNGINPVVHAKRLKNLQKLKEEGKLDKYLNLLTEEEFDMFFN
jgi:hypothetical protein